jgi:hypothetical protein
MVRGFTVCGCANVLRKNRFAASASRLADNGKFDRLASAVGNSIQIDQPALDLHIRSHPPARSRCSCAGGGGVSRKSAFESPRASECVGEPPSLRAKLGFTTSRHALYVSSKFPPRGNRTLPKAFTKVSVKPTMVWSSENFGRQLWLTSRIRQIPVAG